MELLHLLIALLLVIAITVVPVMVAARWARARRRGFFHCLAAVVLATVIAQLALAVIDGPLLGLVVAFVLACGAYALVLGTTFVSAVGIAVVALVLQVLILAGLLWLGLQIPFLASAPISV